MCNYGFDKNWHQEDDSDQDEIGVACRECGNTRDMSQAEAPKHDSGRPHRGAKDVEHREDASGHHADASGDGSEGTHNGHETRDRDGRRTEAVKESLGAGDALAAGRRHR